MIAVDIDDAKLKLATKCGARECIHSGSEDLASRLLELTEGHGPSVVIEAVGLPATFRAAVDVVSFAGRVVYIGYAKAPVEYETKWFILKEIDIRGSRNALRPDFDAVIQSLQRGMLPTEEIVTQTAMLADACDALRQWNESPGSVTKIQVRFQ